jgi:hypothetical protein
MSNMAPDASAEADHFDNDLLERIGGERLSVGYHNPFLLNDPGLVYLVLQGRVEIYLTPLLGGQVCGPGMHVSVHTYTLVCVCSMCVCMYVCVHMFMHAIMYVCV